MIVDIVVVVVVGSLLNWSSRWASTGNYSASKWRRTGMLISRLFSANCVRLVEKTLTYCLERREEGGEAGESNNK